MKREERYMQRCLNLAELGIAEARPNPSVGCVIVHEDRIIGEGFTSKFGGNHAEVNAVEAVVQKYGETEARRLIGEAEVFVSLEPCAHYGKTLPCAELLADYKPRKVNIGCVDPSEKVAGKGVDILRKAGIPCQVGILQENAQWMIRRFATQVQQHRPYVILKWAETADGYFGFEEEQQKWISHLTSKQLVHKWRSEEAAILVGKNTAMIDNPTLTVREWEGKNPLRVLIDKRLEVPLTYNIFNEEADTLVFNAVKFDVKDNVRYIEIENFDLYLPQNILYQLYLMDITSILVEGGAKTLQSYIDAGMWDEARIFTSPQKWGRGIPAPKIEGEIFEEQKVGKDILKMMKKV